LRHFHDSLISPGLFNLYLYNSAEAQLQLHYLMHLRQGGHSMEIATFAKEADLYDFFTALTDAKREFSNKYRYYFDPVLIGGGRVGIEFFFEMSAVVSEVASVMAFFGETAGMQYWNLIRQSLPAHYTRIFSLFLDTRKNFHKAVDVAMTLFMLALVQPANPLKTFFELATGGLGNLKLKSPQSGIDFMLSQCEEVHRNWLVRAPTLATENSSGQIEELFSDSLVTQTEVAQLRSGYIDVHIKNNKLRLDEMWKTIEQYPLPATYFFPSEADMQAGTAPAMYRDDFIKHFGDVYVLTARGDGVVTAGITPFPWWGVHMPVRPTIKKVDLMVMAQWMTQVAFENVLQLPPEIETTYRSIAGSISFGS
jgi:hypothetical protein